MSAPYWGVLPLRKVKRVSVAHNEKDNNGLGDIQTSISSDWQTKPSARNQQNEATTASTLSPTSLEFQRGGLAPRPASSSYNSSDYSSNLEDRRRQRQSRYQHKVSGEISAPFNSHLLAANFHERSDGVLPINPEILQPQPLKKINGLSGTKSLHPIKNPNEINHEVKPLQFLRRPSDPNGAEFLSRRSERLQRVNYPLRTGSFIDRESMQDIEFSPDRSPLQRLEMTLGSMTKEEKRARVQGAEVSPERIDRTRQIEKSKSNSEDWPIFKSQATPSRTNSNHVRGLNKKSLNIEPNSTGNSNFSTQTKNDQVNKLKARQNSAELPTNHIKNSIARSDESNTESQILKAETLTGNQSARNEEPPRTTRHKTKLEGEKRNGGFSTNGVASSETRTGPVDLSRHTRSQSNTLILKDKELPELPQGSSTHVNNSESSVAVENSSKPVRRGTLSRLSRLASEKISLKSPKENSKSPKNDNSVRVEDVDLLKSPVSLPVENNLSPTKPTFENEDSRYFVRPSRINKHLPSQDCYIPSPRLDEWRNGAIAQLSGTYLDIIADHQNAESEAEKAWWESRNANLRRGSNLKRRAEAYDGEYDDNTAPTRFKPPLFLRCGPMLRYCGLRREVPRNRLTATLQEREIWRGTVMIVCQDSHSSYELAPTLRLFLQPVELLPPPPVRVDGPELAPEYIDPIAGLSRIGRDGRTLYVRPVEEIDVEKDLSREESGVGLYEMNRTQFDDGTNHSLHSQKLRLDGEKIGKYKEVRGFRLHSEQGMTFWRFNLEIELREKQQRVAYRINRGPATGFWVPPSGQAMNIMYHGCNSFSRDINPDQYCGPDPMWRDVLNCHQTQPFHVMIGGGNQICNDNLMHASPQFKLWSDLPESRTKESYPFSSQFQQELEAYYLHHYCTWFSQGLFGLAVSQIPMVNMIADYDISDGFGSHNDTYMRSSVMSGLGAVAFKYYMLFQHQSSIDEGEDTEPSWVLGVRPGPCINELSRSIFTRLGRTIAFLGLDCCTERTSDEILSSETYQRIFARLQKEVVKGDTRHLLVLVATPHTHMRSVCLEKKSPSRVIHPFKKLGRSGSISKSLLNKSERLREEPDEALVLRNTKGERKWFIQGLQELAEAKSVRISILGGGVNIGAVGLLYSNPKSAIPSDRDFRYMPIIISAGIVNAPIPDSLADFINKKSKVHHLDNETNEDMISIFVHDVDGKPRTNQRLLNCRHWCSIRTYDLSSSLSWKFPDEDIITPKPQRSLSLFRRFSGSYDSRKSPTTLSSSILSRGKSDVSRPPLSNPQFFNEGNGKEIAGSISVPRQTSKNLNKPSNHRRTLSLTRNDFNFIDIFRRSSRRLSHSDELNGYENKAEGDTPFDSKKIDSGCGLDNDHDGYSPVLTKPTRISQEKSIATEEFLGPAYENDMTSPKEIRDQLAISTKLNRTSIKKDRIYNDINREGSLDIRLNMEINPKDPAGVTMPYRLLVPALFYNESDVEDRETPNL
ncbi:putative metallo-dependent phosphatase [Golovinomyces cichoracearum]|uniref:Putative metallo-dependent phosphatase n=1 Tax=Golovinomyces cichoracearum TaxID=62708 RepID=A0A420INR7_9PEZI|nr:putative metallo-dependent phosphatase [Golovinomyces cichoracearum]